MKQSFTVIRVLDKAASYRPVALHLGSIEIRPAILDSTEERKEILLSSEIFGLKLSSESTNMRIATIVEADSPENADKIAEPMFDEVLDVLANAGGVAGLARFSLIDSGCILNLESGLVQPRKKNTNPISEPNASYQMVREQFPPLDPVQYLWLLPDSELKKAITRSYYWSRKAHWELDKQLKVLFSWFALEAIFLADKNEDIIPKILLCLGYPTNYKNSLVNPMLLTELNTKLSYKSWKAQIESRLRRIKKFRNDSVHDGFRPQDVLACDMKRFIGLIRLACPRSQYFVRVALYANITTLHELTEYLPLLFNEHIKPNDVHGTILHSLEHPIDWMD